MIEGRLKKFISDLKEYIIGLENNSKHDEYEDVMDARVYTAKSILMSLENIIKDSE